MNNILDKVRTKLLEVTDFQDVYIGEAEGDIPAGIINYAIIDEANPTEGFEYSGTSVKNTLYIDVKAFTITANAFVESSIKQAIALSKLVMDKLHDNPTLDGLCRSIRLISIDSIVGQIEGDEQKFLRGRSLRYQITRYGAETNV